MCKFTYHIGLEAGLVLPLQQLSPIDAVEEVVCLDLRCALCAQPLVRVAVEQAGQQVSCSRWYNLGAREMQRLGENLAVHIVGVLVVEWWQTSQHLVQEHTKRPPIDRLGVAGTGKKFRSKVLWSSTES